MVAKIHYRWDFIGLSTDNKPTPDESPKVVNGSTYYESDTSKLFVFYKDTWYERKSLGGGGGGSSYTAGDGIEIENNTISVDTEVVQPKLTAGTNITIDADNVISAQAGGSDGARTLKLSDYNWPADNPDGVAMWLMPVGFYRASDEEPVKVYITSTFSYTVNAKNFAVMVTYKDSGVELVQWHYNYDSVAPVYADIYVVNPGTGAQAYRHTLKSGIINYLTSTSTTIPLAAAQGKVLKDMIDNLPTGEPDYSTSEVDTGTKWVDEKTIYKKTVEIPSLPSNGPYNISLGITNLYRVIEVKGFLYNPLAQTDGLPLVCASPNAANSQIGVTIYSGQLQIDYSGRSGWSGYATVYYTKSA